MYPWRESRQGRAEAFGPLAEAFNFNLHIRRGLNNFLKWCFGLSVCCVGQCPSWLNKCINNKAVQWPESDWSLFPFLPLRLTAPFPICETFLMSLVGVISYCTQSIALCWVWQPGGTWHRIAEAVNRSLNWPVTDCPGVWLGSEQEQQSITCVSSFASRWPARGHSPFGLSWEWTAIIIQQDSPGKVLVYFSEGLEAEHLYDAGTKGFLPGQMQHIFIVYEYHNLTRRGSGWQSYLQDW